MPAEAPVEDLGEEGRRIAGLTCAEVAARLPALVDGPVSGRRLDRRVGRHVEQCLRCQAEVAGYRRLLRTLHDLRTDVLDPPPGAVAQVLAALAEAGERRARRALVTGRRVGYGTALVLAVAAAAAGALVAGRRSARRA